MRSTRLWAGAGTLQLLAARRRSRGPPAPRAGLCPTRTTSARRLGACSSDDPLLISSRRLLTFAPSWNVSSLFTQTVDSFANIKTFFTNLGDKILSFDMSKLSVSRRSRSVPLPTACGWEKDEFLACPTTVHLTHGTSPCSQNPAAYSVLTSIFPSDLHFPQSLVS